MGPLRSGTAPLFAALLLSLPLFGQRVTLTPGLALVDNTAWCATNNCLTSLGGSMAEIKAGAAREPNSAGAHRDRQL